MSLTSHSTRLEASAPRAIYSILDQTYKPDKVVLYLGHKYSGQTPQQLLDLQQLGLEIRYCDDIGSATKLIPALKDFPDDCIITLDDDCYYHKNILEILITAHKQHPNKIICNNTRYGEFTTDGAFKWASSDWLHGCGVVNFKYIFPQGVGGILYPPKSLHPEVLNIHKLNEICRTHDDVWFWAMGLFNNTEYHWTGKQQNFTRQCPNNRAGGISLQHDSLQQKGNSTPACLERAFKTYPQILQRLIPQRSSREHETSIVVGIRNRNQIFADTIKGWLKFNVPEIIVADFRDDSCESVWDIIKPLNDPRIKVIETKYEYRWSSGIARNLAASMATSPFLLFADVDYGFSPDFFTENTLDDFDYIHNIDRGERSGLLYIHKSMYDYVNGNNEDLIYFGATDTDIVVRLKRHFGDTRRFAEHTMWHKEHPMRLRCCNQLQQKTWLQEWQAHTMKDKTSELNHWIRTNIPWTRDCNRIQWNVEQIEENRYLAIRKVGK